MRKSENRLKAQKQEKLSRKRESAEGESHREGLSQKRSGIFSAAAPCGRNDKEMIGEKRKSNGRE